MRFVGATCGRPQSSNDSYCNCRYNFTDKLRAEIWFSALFVSKYGKSVGNYRPIARQKQDLSNEVLNA